MRTYCLAICWWISSLTWCQESQEYLQELKREREQLNAVGDIITGKLFLAAVDTLPENRAAHGVCQQEGTQMAFAG